MDAPGAVSEMLGYFAELIERRRSEPGDDTVSQLVAAGVGDDDRGLISILAYVFTMVTGGNDTTTGLLGGAVQLLDRHPDQCAQLVADPALIPDAVEELLRRCPHFTVDLDAVTWTAGPHVRRPTRVPARDRCQEARVTGWIGDERAQLAAARILDAAAGLFAEQGAHGLDAVSMREIAGAAGCSRATLYRYFADRGQLQMAFVHREARRVGAEVDAAIAPTGDPEARVTAAISYAVRRVRDAPALAVEASRWLVRVVVSRLTVPGRDGAEEEAMVARFVSPVVVDPYAAGPPGPSPAADAGPA